MSTPNDSQPEEAAAAAAAAAAQGKPADASVADSAANSADEVADRGTLGRASAIMAIGTMISRILGFAKAIVLAATIGVIASAADAFGLANQLPNSIYTLIAGGVLNAVLVPQLVRAGVNRAGGGDYINRLLTLAMVLLGSVTIIATVAAPLLVTVYAGASQSSSPDTLALAVAFAYWCMPQIFFYGLYTLLGEVLNARSYFGPFMWAPVLNNVIGIAGLVSFLIIFGPMADSTAHPPESWRFEQVLLLAGSATAGVVVQALVLYVFWRKIGLRFRPDFRWRGVGLRGVGRAAGWTFAMLIVMQLGGIVSTQVVLTASGDHASLAALQNSWLVFMLPHSVAAVSITTAYFTRMSDHARRGKRDALKLDLSAAIRSIGLVTVLATAVLMVCAMPFARVFVDNAVATRQLGEVVLAYMPGLVAFSLLFVVQRAFFAQEDTRTPFLITCGYIVVFSIGVLSCLWLPKSLTAVGIAAVTSIGMTLHAAAAYFVLRRRLGALGGRQLLTSHLRYLAAAAVSAAAGLAVLWLLGGFSGGFATGNRFSALASMVVIGSVMLAVYLPLLRLLRSPELGELLAPITARLRRRG